MENRYEKHRCTCEKCEPKKQPEKVERKCKGCVCDQLRGLTPLTEVNIHLSGGHSFEGVFFITFLDNSCCVLFTDPTTEPDSPLIVDCQDIQAIQIVAG